MSNVRAIREEELQELLDLYHYLNSDDPKLQAADVQELWNRIQQDRNMHHLVVEDNDRIAAACVLVLVPNLTRGARPYGLIENVVTHPDFRRKGYGTRVLQEALAIAWEQNCYKVMLLTSSRQEGTIEFYEKAGFVRGIKTGFIAKPST
ncbi:N-acetylglutamate synthase, GNAT family [Paenibacillus catalpae]|uniref:N-acetylglutamate synthase, GNAT family n=1 Tax=Paenibacillus catalpae TaxID=1045775 RepID=A0A1I1WYZ6_9BACL|nr:GNAT family N-acetyltransferase [Paenibacillus catalpae]SFD98310.1 N-acetylglutamate synthase, GNAT family [Paenibacillus catalpae]